MNIPLEVVEALFSVVEDSPSGSVKRTDFFTDETGTHPIRDSDGYSGDKGGDSKGGDTNTPPMDLDKIKDPAIRAQISRTMSGLFKDFPKVAESVKAISAQALGSFQVGVFTGGAIHFEPAFMTAHGMEEHAKEARNGEYQPGAIAHPLQAIVSHEFGHALEDAMMQPWRDLNWKDPKWQFGDRMLKEIGPQAVKAPDGTWTVGKAPEGAGKYGKTDRGELFAESFAETRTLPRSEWSPAAHQVHEFIQEAKGLGIL